MNSKVRSYKFGPFVLDILDKRLFYKSQLSDLSHTHCAILAILIENQGHVVERRDLLSQSGWAADTLYQQMGKIRKALVDVDSVQTKSRGLYIENHRGHGHHYEGGYSFKDGIEIEELEDTVKRNALAQIATQKPLAWKTNAPRPDRLWGGIEAGGSKFIVAVGTDGSNIHKREVIQVEGEREHTINKVVAFFKKYERRLVGVGIGCFGPIGLNPENKQDYGKILLTTPKQKWRGYPILADMVERLKVPISLTQNVNASLLGEVEFGVGKGKKLETCVYFTVGAGIGAGIIANGDFVRGLSHPELGHILVPRASEEKKGFDGICIHKICLEGMASGWAIEKRWGKPGERLGDRDDVWTLEARYLSYGIASIILTLMPQLIILGGGVMEAPKLLGKIHSEVEGYLGRYIKVPEIDSNIESYIVMPALKGKDGIYESGIRGAIALAQEQQRTI